MESRPNRHLILTYFILIAIIAGVLVGIFLGPQAAPLGNISKTIIDLIKALATPLVFLLIIRSIIVTKVGGRDFTRVFVVAFINGVIALSIGLIISNLVLPGQHFREFTSLNIPSLDTVQLDLVNVLKTILPDNIVSPFLQNLILPVILFALIIGFAFRSLASNKHDEIITVHLQQFTGFIFVLLRITEVVIGWVILLIPFAIFGVIAKAVGQHGFDVGHALLIYLICAIGGFFLHYIFYLNWLFWVVKVPIGKFITESWSTFVYAFGSNSSLVTLPLTLQTLDRLKVSRSSSTLGAGVLTNFNNDGIMLYETMTVLLIAQAYGIHLSFTQQLFVAGLAMVMAAGIAGIPEAGVISLTLLLNVLNIPLDLLFVILTVDWFIARMRSVTNVFNDMVISLVLERWRNHATWRHWKEQVMSV